MKFSLVFLIFVLAADAKGQETDKIQKYLNLARTTLENPITHGELKAAVLSEEGIATIASLFEKSIRESLIVAGKVVTPELGGEATLSEGVLKLVEYPDPTHSVIRRLVELKEDPRALVDFLMQSPEGQDILKTTGGLHALLYQISGNPTRELSGEQRNLLEQVVWSAVSIHFKTWKISPEIQMEMIQRNEWQGRYVGFWHIHPPRANDQGLTQGIEPSGSDMANAVEKGQFVTIVFQPDGFDFYDLSPLAQVQRSDLSKARVISYRSAQWEPAFRALFQRRMDPPRSRPDAPDGASTQPAFDLVADDGNALYQPTRCAALDRLTRAVAARCAGPALR